MRPIKTFLTLLLAVVWMPVSSHCLILESAKNLAVLACCSESHAEQEQEHQRNACESDGCAVVEDAQYRSTLERVTVPSPDMCVLFELPPFVEINPKPLHGFDHSRRDDLFCLTATWQFSSRAALPPRAPSSVS
jgi:hypothetical protein